MTAAAPTHHTPRFDARWLVEVLALAALYFLTARLGLLMAIPGGHVTPVWPPSGIALAAVLLRGRRVWPGIWLGSFAANFWDFYGSPMSLATELATSVTFGIGASLTALLGSQLLRRFVGERNPLQRVRDVCAFMALGGVVSCLVSATVGVTTLCLAGFALWSGYGQAWLTWWLGDTAGVFIVAPLLLVWGGTRRRESAARWVELFGGFGLLIAVTYYLFIENTTVLFTGKPLKFILIPFLVWSAVRFGRRGAATAAGLIALLAVWGTIHGSGPFNLGSRNESLLALELFLSVVSLTALCIAAVVTERRHAESNRRRVLDELESRVAERTASLDQANTALRESEARTRVLIKSSNIGLWDWNLVANEVFFSLEWKSQLGYADDEVPGRYEEWESRLHPEDREPTLRAVQDFREGRREDYDMEFRLRHKDGSWRSILTRADLIRDGAGQPVRMMGCHIDITERQQAEDRLRRSEEKFKTLFGIVPVGISVLDRQHNVVDANPALEQITRLSKEELLNGTYRRRTYLNADGTPKPPNEMASARAITENRPLNDVETGIVTESGEIIWTQVSAAPLALRDASAVVITQDITERKRAAKELEEANHQLQILSRRLFEVQEEERRHLARELHDEIGQALTAAKINLQSITGNGGRANFARLQETTAILDRLLGQVRQISLDLRPSMLDDLGLVPALRSLLDQQGRRASVTVRFSAENILENLDPEIQTTCFRIAQEAITNAVRHANARQIDVDLQCENGKLRLLIRDNGVGFDVQSAQAQTIGLGLIGIKERAALFGGRAKIISLPNKGTMIEVSLPLAFRPERQGRHIRK